MPRPSSSMLFVPPTGVHAMHGVLKRDFNTGLKIWFYFNRGKIQRGTWVISNQIVVCGFYANKEMSKETAEKFTHEAMAIAS
ncbi:hypothetical protein BCV72DRAFT_310557 [Rhizopus microsporus var. microsporus]|uniref:Uncharacterized protein n=1 Tax=Rhizopus microsporus var. microsporus TaxID=86635 RepID=A0A1X0QM83_RHIZD|nr:hypothetical protein BCV72DRAFT_310557 [Rhizopus microsporus var. microsporus]